MLVEILTVCVVIYLYLNVVYHLKTSNELAVYDLTVVNKSNIDQMCSLRQPFVFKSVVDDYLYRPPMTVTVKEEVVRDTELQYTNCYRTFIHGKCSVRLACPNSPLRVEKDHLVPKYYTTSDASGCSLEVSLDDDVVFVPAYWWYRVTGTATVVHYKTAMNEFATLPDTVLHWLQRQHVVYVPKSPKQPLEAAVDGLKQSLPPAPSAPPPAGGLSSL
jgi:hypothetical protein